MRDEVLALCAGIGTVLVGCGRIGFDAGGDPDVGAGTGDGPVLGAELCNGLDDDGDTEIDEGDVCPASCTGILREGRGYMLCTTSVMPTEARDRCQQAGLQMIRIDDAAENAFVRSLVDPLPNPQAWIGASDAVVEGEWRWSDGDQFWQGSQTGVAVGGLYSNWASSQPDDQQGVQDCAESIPQGLWLDEPCDNPAAIDVVFCEQRE